VELWAVDRKWVSCWWWYSSDVLTLHGHVLVLCPCVWRA